MQDNESDCTADMHGLSRIQIPMQRLGRPEEGAAGVGFLFSDAAAYVTGQVIGVNVGLV